MRLPLTWFRWLHRRKLSRAGMRGGRLHRWFGDRLLAKDLWKPTRTGLARAWLIGFPITMIPFLPVQSVIACAIGLFFRANLLLTIALQFLSTPVTMIFHLPPSYLIGKMLQGENPVQVYRELVANWRTVFEKHNVFSLYLGAVVLGVIGGLIGYAVINAWPERKRHRPPAGAPPPPSAPPQAPAG